MRSKTKTIPIAMAIVGILGTFMFISTSDVYASAIQNQPANKIFAASCSTCHAATGLGGVTWVKNDPSDQWTAPKVAGLSKSTIKIKVRNGSSNGRMPAFGPEEITNAELDLLATMLNSRPLGLTLANGGIPAVPVGTAVTLNIIDADPWFQDDNADGNGDRRRVALAAGQYLKIYNAGRTWHTFTNSDASVAKDSGFIGYAGNYKNSSGDLGDIGYYYAEQGTDIKTGCYRYLCKMHPYMQVETCTAGYTPQGPTAAGTSPLWPGGPAPYVGTTRAHKHPIGLPAVPGVGEVWVATQSDQELAENTDVFPPGKSTNNFDGSYQAINVGGGWGVTRIPNVGNNPHNAWPGKDGGGNDVVMSANWHDNTVTLMDAVAKTVINERRSGTTNAHMMVTPGAAERFYVTHMGGRALQQLDVDILKLGGNPNVFAGHIRGATGPHGLWMCDDGTHVLTADTFGKSATLYNLLLKKSKTASSGGKSPLAPAIMSGFEGGCRRGFTNNALTADVSVYEMHTPVTPTSGGISHVINWVPNAANHLDKNAGGNIDLKNLTVSQQVGPNNPISALPSSVFMARWANLPIQTPVSPGDSGTRHGRYMVTANKASFNVSVTKLNATTGLPEALYTFPAGLGAHGVTYGRKSVCSNAGTGNCYYAYVTNTFEDYVSVYDLEAIENGSMGLPGSALLSEAAYVEGGAVTAVAVLDPVVASLCDVVDLVAGVLVYDLPGGADPGGDGNATGILACGIGVLPAPGGPIAEGGPIGGFSYYVANLPIGVLCPDCRSGVHAGDIPLNIAASGASPLGGTTTGPLTLTATGAGARYTYVKDEVYVDTETVGCVLGANDCNSATPPLPGQGGTLNLLVSMDLDLGISTGGQGIMSRPAAFPWP